MAAVAARLAWVTLVVRGPTTPAVLLDDVEVPAPALGVRLACNPGAHLVKATAPEFAPGQQAFAISEGAERTIVLALRPQPAALASAPPAPVAAPPAPTHIEAPPESRSSVQTTAGYGVLGVGAAALAAGGITGVLVLVRHASLTDSCPDGRCSPDYAGELHAYRTLANVSTAATIVGVAGVVTGATLLLTSPRATPVRAYAGPLNAGIAGSF